MSVALFTETVTRTNAASTAVFPELVLPLPRMVGAVRVDRLFRTALHSVSCVCFGRRRTGGIKTYQKFASPRTGQNPELWLHPSTMTEPFVDFTACLEADEPPAHAGPLLRAVWHGLKGHWAEAHQLAQGLHNAEGFRVHAWLHRIEGDLANAGYWYRRAGRAPADGDTRTEGLDIASSLLR